MVKTVPEKTLYYCDICGNEMVNYVDYDRNTMLRIIPTKRKNLREFIFKRKEVTEINGSGIRYEYKELLVCGHCYDRMIEFAKREEGQEKDCSTQLEE